jgi:hypothetical protein
LAELDEHQVRRWTVLAMLAYVLLVVTAATPQTHQWATAVPPSAAATYGTYSRH